MKNVFFDFDGTLADTRRGIINGYNYAFDKIGLPRASEEMLLMNIGPPLKEVLRNLAPDEPEERIDRLAVLYREYYSSDGLYELEFFDGIRDMLECVDRKDVRLRILSSKPTAFIENILNRYGYMKYFDGIDGVSLGYSNKSKKERLKDRMTSEGLDPADCIVVGDREEDLNAARHCGAEFIGVLFGYGSKEELEGSVTVKSVGDLNDSLTAWIERS